MKKRRLFLVLGALAVYFLLLCLLIAAESAARLVLKGSAALTLRLEAPALK